MPNEKSLIRKAKMHAVIEAIQSRGGRLEVLSAQENDRFISFASKKLWKCPLIKGIREDKAKRRYRNIDDLIGIVVSLSSPTEPIEGNGVMIWLNINRLDPMRIAVIRIFEERHSHLGLGYRQKGIYLHRSLIYAKRIKPLNKRTFGNWLDGELPILEEALLSAVIEANEGEKRRQTKENRSSPIQPLLSKARFLLRRKPYSKMKGE